MPHYLLTLTVQAHPAGATVVRVTGELDLHTAARMRRSTDRLPLAPGGVLVLDLSGLTFCDSVGVAELLHVYRTAVAAGATAAFAGATESLLSTARTTGLDQVLSFVAGVDDALPPQEQAGGSASSDG
ncbi:STAS domain-containing protein [Kitasatospora sp. NPDC101801]|uniref:STAS domain-containing protein n=1 Tax=Kitasatospora sp. NPDC101801 TaxID=3364103 RepID=UPI003821FFB7